MASAQATSFTFHPDTNDNVVFSVDEDLDDGVGCGGIDFREALQREISERKALQRSFEEFRQSAAAQMQQLSERCTRMESGDDEGWSPDPPDVTLPGKAPEKDKDACGTISPYHGVSRRESKRSISRRFKAMRSKVGKIFSFKENSNGEIYTRITSHRKGSFTKRDRPTELPLFVFSNLMGVKRSVTVVTLSVVCILVKALLVCIVGDYLTTQRITEETIADIWEWRTTNAHDIKFMSLLTSESLARRVCSGHQGLQMSSVPSSLLGLLRRYRPPDTTGNGGFFNLISRLETAGAITCALALGIWGTTVLIKARSLLELAMSLWIVPTVPGTVVCKEGDDGGICIVSAPFGRKIGWALWFLAEASILLALTFFGCEYILNDFDPQDLILNCAALALVEELDAMAFTALLPDGCFMLVGEIAVPAVPHRSRCKLFSEWLLGIPLLTLFIVTFFYEQVRLADLIDRAGFALCGGNLDFVFAMDPGGAVVASRVSHGGERAVTDRYFFRAVKELVESDAALQGNVETSLSDGAIGAHYGQLSVDLRTKIPFGDRMAGLNPDCKDFSGGIAVWPSFFTQMLIEDEYGGPVPMCENASEYCSADNALGLRMRQWCPETCGCDRPSSSQVMLFENGGCPPPCFYSASYLSSLSLRACEDEPPDSPDFLNYMDGLRQLARSYTSDSWIIRFGQWIAALQEGGCNNTQLSPAVFGSLCRGNAFNLKPLLYVCPMACGCPTDPPRGFPDLCPLTC